MIEATPKYPRKKASVLAAGMSMSELAKLHAIKSNQQKKAEAAIDRVAKAQASIEYFWERVFAQLDEQEALERETA